MAVALDQLCLDHGDGFPGRVVGRVGDEGQHQDEDSVPGMGSARGVIRPDT